MATQRKVSLLNLSKQLPFLIDDNMKKNLCFAETLIISCSHYDGRVGEEYLVSDDSCEEIEVEESVEEKQDEAFVVKDKIIAEPESKDESDEDNDFHFYFFPDCSKPAGESNSQTSLLLVDGVPKVNPAVKNAKFCTCTVNRKGECECYTKLPCYCGAKAKANCTCDKLEDVCICDETKPPAPVCTCKGSKACLCHPDGKIRPVCECAKIEKPCFCNPALPCPVCACKGKPKKSKAGGDVKDATNLKSSRSRGEAEGEGEGEGAGESLGESLGEAVLEGEGEQEGEGEGDGEGENESKTESLEPCDCQKPQKKPFCECLKGKECICVEDSACVCGLRKTCVCEPEANKVPTCTEETRSICSCPEEPVCTCDAELPDQCKCMPKPETCVCGDPTKCKCHIPCDCAPPCICGTKVTEECTCPSQRLLDVPICTCKDKFDRPPDALKKVKAGKEGFRWCHEVDPKHTYFDYAYNRFDKIDDKVQEKEKFKILGLDVEKKEEEPCPVHGITAPPFEKKVRKPSLDCCSAVGGISISVETLGEDKDKFLIQVVSNSSKEGAKTGTKLVSIVDCNLHTLEESRIEHITNKKTTKERRIYLAICENGYYSKITHICGDHNVVKRLYHSFDDTRELLLEGGNLVFLRYLGITRFKGTIKTDTLLIDGLKCESIYVANGMTQAIVNGNPLYVVKVERHIIEPSGALHQTLSVMTLKGNMVSHEWADNAYVIHLNPLLKVDSAKDEIEPHAPLREKWREDLQLLSDYLDFKSARTSEGGRYVRETSDLTNTIRDYLQALLLLRPGDAIHFTRHYFGTVLSALDLPCNEYFDVSSKHVRYYFFEE